MFRALGESKSQMARLKRTFCWDIPHFRLPGWGWLGDVSGMSREISAPQLAEKLKSEAAPKLLDVRQPEEHALACLPGSILIPLPELMQRVEEIAGWRDEEVVVYCHHGIRSLHAISFLQAAGFRNLSNLSGGINAWSMTVDDQVRRY